MINPVLRERKQVLRSFMRQHYTDERLAMLLAHAQEGRLAWYSCCCFVGITTADHALQGVGRLHIDDSYHLSEALHLDGALMANAAYGSLGNDYDRRLLLIPMIRAEMRRRERAKTATSDIGREQVALK